MILGIALGIIALLTMNNIIKNVGFNHRMTKDVNKSDRRKLIWRYGPFKIDDYVVDQHLVSRSRRPSIPLDIIKSLKIAA